MGGTSCRVNETYIRVGKTREYLYRAVNKGRNTIEFVLSAKQKARGSQCFKRFHTAERTLEGIEAVNMMRKGQVKRLAGSDAQEQAKLIASLFGVAA